MEYFKRAQSRKMNNSNTDQQKDKLQQNYSHSQNQAQTQHNIPTFNLIEESDDNDDSDNYNATANGPQNMNKVLDNSSVFDINKQIDDNLCDLSAIPTKPNDNYASTDYLDAKEPPVASD